VYLFGQKKAQTAPNCVSSQQWYRNNMQDSKFIHFSLTFLSKHTDYISMTMAAVLHDSFTLFMAN